MRQGGSWRVLAPFIKAKLQIPHSKFQTLSLLTCKSSTRLSCRHEIGR
uniref:Uncharacterized protein n=1 Tax=Anguilla anguilla TaxID=7936 RepID=A0A0E9WJ45_ANGAN